MSGEMLDSLKGLLGDNADEKIRTVLESLNSNKSAPDTENTIADTDSAPEISRPASPPVDLASLEYIGKIKSIADEIGMANDSRSHLLESLRPFMRTERQKSIDTAIKLLNLSKFSGLFRL